LSTLLGRDTELSTLRAALADAAAGRGRPILLEGTAGAGKSALMAVACEHARSTGMRVLTARGNEMEREFGFGVVRQLFGHTLADAAPTRRERLLAGDAGPAPIAMDPVLEIAAANGRAGPAMLHALHGLAGNLADEQPLLLAVDDLHWSDVSSVRALGYLAGRIADVPVASLVAVRPDEPGAPEQLLNGLRAEAEAVRVHLGPLDRAVVAQLVRQRFPDADDEVCEACYSTTAGNPLYLEELLRSVPADGLRGGSLPAAAIHEASVPSLGDRIARRIEPIADAAPVLASAMAVVGDGGALSVVAALAGVSRAEAGKIAGRMRRIEVLSAEDPFVFVHPLVRRSIYDAMSVPERDAAHGAAAELLEAGTGPAEAVAAHRGAIRPRGSAQVATTLHAAAEEALSRAAPDEAVRWLRRALDEGADDPPPAVLLALLGTTEVILWDERAIGHLRQVLELTDDVTLRVRVSVPLAEVLFLTGGWAEAMEVVTSTLRDLEETEAEAAAGLTAIGLMVTGYAPLPADTLDNDPAVLDRLMEGPSWAAHALAAVLAAMTAHRGGEACRVISLVDAALRNDVLLEVRGRETWAVAHALIALAEIDEHERGLEFSDRLLTVARRTGMPNLVAAGTSHRGWLLARRGDLAAAEAAVRPALEAAIATGAPTVFLSTVFYLQDALLERPSLDDVAALAEQSDLDDWGLGGTMMAAMFLTARGRLRLARGDRDNGLNDLRAAMDTGAALGASPNVFPSRSLVALALPADDHDEARALVAEELDAARATGFPRPVGLALRAAGILARGDEGAQLISESLPYLERAGARLELARSHIELGANLRRAGRRRCARSELTRGMELARECGADRLAARGLEELKATGARPRRSATTGPGALTASELRVAHLAAAGATNQDIARDLFVSPKTVETHLSHAYAKLGLAGPGSRTRLAETLGGPEPAVGA
jgi:DNA-binding CsgD family transcriptional regulator